jgi:hypothetical protein
MGKPQGSNSVTQLSKQAFAKAKLGPLGFLLAALRTSITQYRSRLRLWRKASMTEVWMILSCAHG